jgi:hypothetical protein
MTSFRHPGPQGLAPLSAVDAHSLRMPGPFDPAPAIEVLELAPIARTAAYALRRAHPVVTLTSGRRNKQAQARPRVSNVARNRRRIAAHFSSH